MISRILLFLVLILTSMGGSAQMFIYEDFLSGQMPPAGWTISEVPELWSVSPTGHSATTAQSYLMEGRFSMGSGTTITRLISPMIDLTGITSLKFHLCYRFETYYATAPKIGMATRSGGGIWNSAWAVSPTHNLGPLDVNITVSTSDLGSSQFQFCLYLDGDLSKVTYWYFDNISLSNPLPRDGYLQTIRQTPTTMVSPAMIKGTVVNTGTDTIHSAVIDWQMDNGTIQTTNIQGLSVPALHSFDFTCSDMMNPPIGMSNLKVWIQSINNFIDCDQTNDTISETVQMVCYPLTRKPLYEEFSSSTCPYCPGFDQQFIPWCNTHEKDITLVKYQMDWPGQGDPYYTTEGGVRCTYYDVSGVPEPYCDGEMIWGNVDLSGVEQYYGQESIQPGMMNIVASNTLTGHVMSVNATILPYASLPNARLYCAVVEKYTYNNASTSGDTMFQHVMMKMIPDAHGTPVSLVDRQPYSYSASVNLTGTHVERWDDLLVVVWVQDSLANKVVYQSTTAIENGVFGLEDRLSNILVDGTGIAGFDPNTFNYAVIVPGSTIMAPQVLGIPIDPNETVIVIPTRSLPGTTTIDVFAQNNVAHNLYTVDFTFPVGMGSTPVSTISLYPNPATDKVFISGAGHSKVSLYSMTGLCLRRIEDFTGTSFSLTGLQNGVYLLKIERQDGSVVQRKIVVEE